MIRGRLNEWKRRLADVERDAARIRASLPPASDQPVEIETSRPTVPRVGLGLLAGGMPGALLGFAWRKRRRQRIT